MLELLEIQGIQFENVGLYNSNIDLQVFRRERNAASSMEKHSSG